MERYAMQHLLAKLQKLADDLKAQGKPNSALQDAIKILSSL